MSLLCSDVKITIPDSLLVLLIGMVIIFAVLAILIGTVYAYVGVFKGMDKIKAKKSEKKKTEEPAPKSEVNDEELAAAIAAAIAVVYASESEDGEVPPFKVKSIIAK